MKKFLSILVLSSLLAFPLLSYAQNNTQGSGYTGPSAGQVSVAEARKLRDDTPVVLVGKIVKHLGGEKYQFSDGQDTITVDIDNKLWTGLTVGPSDTVEIRGEIDKDFNSLEIDVDIIIKK